MHRFIHLQCVLMTSSGWYYKVRKPAAQEGVRLIVIQVRNHISSMSKSLTTGRLVAATLFAVAALIIGVSTVSADSSSVNFENPPYSVGNINGQDGWMKTGGFDVAVANNTYGIASFGLQTLRISNAVTSGSFGDQTFSKSLADEAGETAAQNGGMSGGTRQSHFEAQFELASVSTAQQPGLIMSVSPDRGDGARMSYLRFEDQADGIHVFFDDVNSAGAFIETDIATLNRTAPHTIKFVMDFVDGANNDVVKIYIDGVLEITGTSWENYFNIGENNPTRTVDSLLFRTSGTAVPANSGNGFLVDNMSLMSGPAPVAAPVHVTIIKYVDGVHATAGNANNATFAMQATYDFTNAQFPSGIAGTDPYDIGPTGNNTPNAYEAQTLEFYPGADYSTYEHTNNAVVGATCADNKPFALAGYKVGDTLVDAQNAAVSATAPAFTDMQSNKYVIVSNVTCVAPTPDVKVTINKFIDGTMATALSANSSAFPMEATWNATNIGAGSGSYDLDADGFNGDPTPYQAITSMMTSGASYSTSETTGGSVVGATCADGKPYALAGYSTGESFAAAQSAATSTLAPAFTNITTDKYVIVRNVKCVTQPPAPTVPPANACTTPGTAPAGYTLQNGTSGNDTVTLSPNTMFVGKGGNDKVSGGNGNYIVCTAGGNDTITLGGGNSTIDAGGGNNTVTVGNGEGTIKTAGGNDTVVAGNGARTIDVGGGNNKVTSGDQAQTIVAGGGNDEIKSGAGDDTVNAGGGNNKLWGEAGADMLTSAAGNDLLDGGADTDTCQAGGGNNTKTSCEL